MDTEESDQQQQQQQHAEVSHLSNLLPKDLQQHDETEQDEKSQNHQEQLAGNSQHQKYQVSYGGASNKKDSAAQIQEDYQNLTKYVDEVNVRMNKLMQKTEEDFLSAYKKQMTNIQRELKILKKKMDEETLKQKADDKMNILQEERDYFRAEALRLDKICKDQMRDIEELKFKMNILQEDKNYYEGFVIETKKENKSLKTELLYLYKHKLGQQVELQQSGAVQVDNLSDLGNNNLHDQSVEGQRAPFGDGAEDDQRVPRSQQEDTKPYFITQPMRPMTQPQFKRQKNSQEEDGLHNTPHVQQLQAQTLRNNDQQHIETIRQLRQMLEREKMNNRKLKVELSQNNQLRSELEQILLDCINEAKKDIVRRRIQQKETIPMSVKSVISPQNFNPFVDEDEEVDYSKFSHKDKIQVLKRFIQSDKFLEKIYDITFNSQIGTKRTQSSSTRATLIQTPITAGSAANRLTESWKKGYQEANQLYKQQFKGFRYTFSAKNFGKKNANLKELSSTHFQFSAKTRDTINKIQSVQI